MRGIRIGLNILYIDATIKQKEEASSRNVGKNVDVLHYFVEKKDKSARWKFNEINGKERHNWKVVPNMKY